MESTQMDDCQIDEERISRELEVISKQIEDEQLSRNQIQDKIN